MFGWTGTFDKYLEKVTNPANLELDWSTILQIVDIIRQNDVQPKYAINAIKRKLYSQNPHVVLHTISVLESCVKNCGSSIHNEVSSFSFMEELRDFIKTTPHATVKNKLLELLQAWAHAFRNEPKYRNVADSITLLKLDGFKFPPPQESDLMFTADTAPDWKDGNCCHRCRVPFSTFQRKHHCRNCGEVFCQRCSAKQCPIPKFGIEKDVRVCDTCWDILNKPNSAQKAEAEGQSPSGQTEKNSESRSQELREEEELQLALALSQSEAEIQEQQKRKSTAPKAVLPPEQIGAAGKEDPELAYYLNRDYWESRQQVDDSRTSPLPSAPPDAKTLVVEKLQNGEVMNGAEANEGQLDEFVGQLQSTIEIFQNRMKSNSSRGRPIALDTYVQSLFMSLTSQHSHLMQLVQDQDQARAHFESLQDKLAQVRDARAALDALRQDHQERLRRQAEEAERLRQAQMAQKLEIMRKQKQEYLEYQRQLALQKMHEAQYYQAEVNQRRFGFPPQPYYQPGLPGAYMPPPPAPGAAAPDQPQPMYNIYHVPGAMPGVMAPGPQGDYPQSPPRPSIVPAHHLPPHMMAPPPTTMAPPPNSMAPPTSMAPPPNSMAPPPNSMAPPPNSMAPPTMAPPTAMAPPPNSMAPPPNSMAPPTAMNNLPPADSAPNAMPPVANTSVPNPGMMAAPPTTTVPTMAHQNMMHMMPPAPPVASGAEDGCLISFD